MSDGGRLYVCGTPIGNLGDVSDRLREVLQTADVVYAEDTRRTATLLRHVGASPSMRSLFVGNEKSRTADLLASLDEGLTVAMVTDAGMPTVSDPGSDVIRLARQAGHLVTVVPGPSAVVAAVALAGFGGDRFVFEGFLPRKGRERSERLSRIGGEDRPVILFVSPHRLVADLESIAAATGPEREIVITREMTKLHEEVWSGPVAQAIEEWSDRDIKGEVTVVIAPGPLAAPSFDAALVEARGLVGGGAAPSEAARRVATETGVSRREIYEVLIDDQRS
ncbi:MAG: Uroporphyrin-III C/tetrapyrrole (Corrin/Porphyrin) methyltransferase [Acidimicrobiia bacterium]|jgi:16S rRNA (cytidine1402-2'-O)-methyltransferase|nr:Uroporphyrin-III C/tetrapyrrole (Corrin/Porphyrin) methyltransferase [Acidimicrobiia bacterium]